MGLSWKNKINAICAIMKKLEFSDSQGAPMSHEKAFGLLRDLTLKVRDDHKTIYVIGNGASASMASHFAADLAKNGKLHTQVFSDLALITAISNDMGYEHVFAEPLRRRGQVGDLLVAISSSGNSKNILEAAATAEKLNMQTVTLSAMGADNPLRSAGNLNAYMPAQTFGEAETVHAALLHYWIDFIVEADK